MSQRLMVLGAGLGQLPVIRRAVELGCTVITVDYLPANIGHRFSQHSVNCSTVDAEGVLRAARELAIDGIITFASDVATPSVSHVAAHLGLPGCPPAAVAMMANKPRFRAFQHAHADLNSPRFFAAGEYATVVEQLDGLTPPLMFKPADTSGSRGVTRVDVLDDAQCRVAFDFARRFSRTGMVCVEEYVEGEDVSGDGFLVDGRLIAVVTQKFSQGFAPVGHGLPTHLSDAQQACVLAEVSANCQAVGYTDGPLDFDMRVSAQRATVLEMSPRLGGNGIPIIIQRATGCDLVTATILRALNQAIDLPPALEVHQACGSLVLRSNRAGTLTGIASADELMRQVPEVFDYRVSRAVGDVVPAFTHGGDSFGYVLFDCPAGYAEVAERVWRAVDVRVN